MAQDQNIPTSAFTDADGSVYIQQQPGSETHFIGGCFEAGDLPNPQGDTEPIYCLDANRQFQVVGSTPTAPGKITSSVTGLTEGSANWLELFVNDFCPFFIHFVQHTCGTRGVWSHWERVYTYLVQAITDDPISAFMSREGGNSTTHAFNWTALPPRIGSRRLGIGRKTTVVDEAANCIWAEPKTCGSDCGNEIKLGQNLMIGHDSDGANPPIVMRSTDFGDTWDVLGNDPHVVDEHIICGCAFPVDKDTMRNVAVRSLGVGPAAPMEIAYTDDAGVTAWNIVVVGATDNEAPASAQSIFAFDQEHIWLCTDDGRVYFSEDGCVTWTDQSSALAASAAGALNSIHFYDANVGVAGGGGPVVIFTIDGGENWQAMVNDPGGVPNSVRMTGPSSLDVISGDVGGDVDRTRDRGASAWVEQFGTFTEVKSLDIASSTVYFLVDDDGGSDDIYQTADGGLTWQAYTTPTNVGLNHILVLSPTLAFAVGEVSTTAVYIKLGQGAA